MVFRITLLSLIAAGQVFADWTIPLSPVDSSFVIHGNKLGSGTKITVTHSCVSCKVQVTAKLYSPTNTSLAASDYTGSTFNTTNLSGSILAPPLTVSVGAGSSTHFILAFTTVSLNETKKEAGFTSTLDSTILGYKLFKFPDGSAATLTVPRIDIARMAVTVVSDAKSMPQMHLLDIYLYPSTCQADFYAGGIPTIQGQKKYYLLTLLPKHQGNLALSTITVSAFTVFLPQGCDLKLTFAKTPPTNLRQMMPGAVGFAMSNEFPGSFVGEQTPRNRTIDYALSDFNTKAHFKVISADPGTGGQLIFTESKDNSTLVLTTNSTNKDFDPIGAYPQVTWNPSGPSRNGFLYTFVVDDKKVETSTRNANSLSIEIMVITLLVRLLM